MTDWSYDRWINGVPLPDAARAAHTIMRGAQ